MKRQRGQKVAEDNDIGEWPTHTLEAREVLDESSRTHYATLLAAFAFDGAVIEPGGYGRHLKGALVQVYFTLRHIKGERTNTFRAKITAIRILVPPPRIKTRRCIVQTDDRVDQ
ncbi:uncharacterized protein BJ212DRAFT_1312482 [Suillus subaureus]|uniref:Uncharacterized protein n=1 Tax=Suillus subaureus TaxID=48587 RepID=A0A9P7JKM0_9AGAM|nr:uncharacterized protein BJ212DRAFT_1312482 [Suillus subaureus]KAG1827457.1 hypothetical protein BJ212DRAFT_1312482 [Suillus subaureus]